MLDKKYMQSLGKFDICYSWGVLHHTGNLWQAIYNAQLSVKKNGKLYIAVYNDQGIISAFWSIIKQIYCSGTLGRVCMSFVFFIFFRWIVQ